jgi:YhcH/YjgK/YiaL family protein
MILDTLSSADQYASLHPSLPAAFAFLRAIDPATLEPGRYAIEADDVYAAVSLGPGKKDSEARLEAHRRYFDVQYVVRGDERMGWKHLKDCQSLTSPYDDPDDIEFFADRPATWVDVRQGSFIVFFPSDAHAPMVSAGQILKVVVKIRVKNL